MNLEKECLKVDILKKQTKRLSKPQKNQPQSRKIGNINPDKRIRIMFQYEAGFGRINKSKYYRCNNKIRPSVPCHHMVCLWSSRSIAYKDEMILLVCNAATWHKLKGVIPENIKIIHILPYTPEMNPIKQIWKQIKSMGFKNELPFIS